MVEEQKNIIDNLTKSVGNRLSSPLIVTYLSVLTIYNWEILFYLFFEKITAVKKIEEIQKKFSDSYYERIIICLIISVLLIFIFTLLNTFLNQTLKWFYKKDKEIKNEITNYETTSILRNQLSESIGKIKKLNKEVESLKTINQNLNIKRNNIKTSQISLKDYEKAIAHLNSKTEKEKHLFSFNELIESLRKDLKVSYNSVINNSTYPIEMKSTIETLNSLNLITLESVYINNNRENRFKLSISMKDILKMDI